MFIMKAYPIELRRRVVDAVEKKLGTQDQIAKTFCVSAIWIRKLLHRKRQTGSIAPHPQNQGRKPAFRDKQLEELNKFVAAHSDATLEEIKEHFAGTVDCSIVAIHTTLKRLGWNYKKKRYTRLSKTGLMSR